MPDTGPQVRRLYHLGIATDRVPDDVVMVEHGIDPVSLLDALLDVADLGGRREFHHHLGTVDGGPVLITRAGLGAPSAAIAVEELAAAGVRRIVWIGRYLRPTVVAPLPLVPAAAIRGEGTSLQYAPVEYPALPDFGLSQRLREVVEDAATGLVETVDVSDETAAIPQDLCSAALFVVAAARGIAVASLLLPDGAKLGPQQAAAVITALAPIRPTSPAVPR